MIFQDIDQDGTRLVAEIFRIYMKDEEMLQSSMAKAREALTHRELARFISLVPGSASISIYDNTVGVFDVSLDISDELSDTDFCLLLDEIQAWSNTYVSEVIERYYGQRLLPLFRSVWDLDPEGDFIQTPGSKTFFLDLKKNELNPTTETLWVNRTLYIDEALNDSRYDALRDRWLMGDAETEGQVNKETVTNDIHLNWGNNFIGMDAPPQKQKDAIEALRLCQYFNTVLEKTNNELSRLIGMALARRKRKKARQIDLHLNEVVETVNLLLVQLRETHLNLQGNRQQFFSELVDKWGLETFRENIENKIAFCKEKIEQLHKEKVKRNQTMMELILFGIAGVALVEFIVSVSSYAKDIAFNPLFDSVQDRIPGLIDVGKMLSPNEMIWLGIFLLFLFWLLYFIFQMRSK